MTSRALALTLLLLSASAHAGDADDTFEAAQRAYAEVDFERAYALGQQALREGGASVEQSTRLFELLGISSAALGKSDEARRYFSVLLAIEPNRQLEQSLSPKVRGPYLEAKGALALEAHPLALSADVQPESSRLRIRLSDPLGLVRNVVVHLRASGAREFTQQRLTAAPRLAVDSSAFPHGFDYALRALDEHGNALCELGTDADPIWVAAPALPPHSSPAGAAVGPTASSAGIPLAVPLTLGAVGVAVLAVGGYFQYRREKSAREWNGADCEHPGQSRAEQCGSVDDQRQRMQMLALGSYALGGALVVSGALTFVLGRPRSTADEPRAELGCAFWLTSASCQGRF